ncbi:amidohydrolase family protein [Alkalimonas sp. MEB108]|uniref:Amidohydrolase family protein n=1 Tax=Alkalimonas cellulosilytica TaxID=3058395 RepID=A0ABU7J6M1_9GAMM|nr:amidohydrolase family protein [Alkalimonas sp. MEB108]MEE2002158.1 amidohydrolase family protein [Alkalimonas sp. MEB108]
MRFLLMCFTLLLAGPSLAATALLNGHWYQEGTFVAQTWYVRDGVLTQQTPAEIHRSVDLQGGFVVPPYAEAHNHNLQNPWLAQNFHQRYLQDGVFYGLMMCGSHQSYGDTQAVLAELTLDIELVGACISSSDGHPLRMALRTEPGQPEVRPEEVYDQSFIVIDTLDDIAAKWPLFAENQARWAKIILVHHERSERRGEQRYFGVNGLQPEVVKPLVAFLQQQGVRVAAHVESAADFALAVEAGVDLIAHLPGYQWWQGYAPELYRLSDEAIAMAADKQIPLVATAGVSPLFYASQPEQLERVKALQRQNLQRLLQAGVPILMGSDRFDANVLAEVDYLHSLAIFSKPQLLQLLVADTARFLFPGRALGRFAEGYEASLLVLDANPLEDWSALRRIQLKMRQGQLLD